MAARQRVPGAAHTLASAISAHNCTSFNNIDNIVRHLYEKPPYNNSKCGCPATCTWCSTHIGISYSRHMLRQRQVTARKHCICTGILMQPSNRVRISQGWVRPGQGCYWVDAHVQRACGSTILLVRFLPHTRVDGYRLEGNIPTWERRAKGIESCWPFSWYQITPLHRGCVLRTTKQTGDSRCAAGIILTYTRSSVLWLLMVVDRGTSPGKTSVVPVVRGLRGR